MTISRFMRAGATSNRFDAPADAGADVAVEAASPEAEEASGGLASGDGAAGATPVVQTSAQAMGFTRSARGPKVSADTPTAPPEASGEEKPEAPAADAGAPEAGDDGTPEETPKAPEGDTPEASGEDEDPVAAEARKHVEAETLRAIRAKTPGLGITSLDQVPELLEEAETQFQVLELVERASDADPRVLPFIKALSEGTSFHLALKQHASDLVRDIDESDPDYLKAQELKLRREILGEKEAKDAEAAATHTERVQQEVEARASDFRARVEAGEEIVPGVKLDTTALREIGALLSPPRGARVRTDLFEVLAHGLNRDAALAHARSEGEAAGREAALREVAGGKAPEASGVAGGDLAPEALDPSLTAAGRKPAGRLDPKDLSPTQRMALDISSHSGSAHGGFTRTRRN